MCGDIEEFQSKNPTTSEPAFVPEGFLLVRNLIEMENKLSVYGYVTPEAGYVFTTLVSKAGKRLGLTDGQAQPFGMGYCWVRTGWFDLEHIEKQHLMKQIIFFKFFFPIGRDFTCWDFNSPAVRTKLRTVLYKFIAWEGNPDSYIQDVRDYREQLEPLWYCLSLASIPLESFHHSCLFRDVRLGCLTFRIYLLIIVFKSFLGFFKPFSFPNVSFSNVLGIIYKKSSLLELDL